MKTIEEFCKELASNEALCNALENAIRSSKVDEFLKQHGINATAEELLDALKNNPDTRAIAGSLLNAVASGLASQGGLASNLTGNLAGSLLGQLRKGSR
ncbi:MAG: hypothetical protein ACI4JC_08790 [Faecalibacterium sp.]